MIWIAGHPASLNVLNTGSRQECIELEYRVELLQNFRAICIENNNQEPVGR